MAAAWTPPTSPRQPMAAYLLLDIPLCACPGIQITTGILRSPNSAALPKHVSFTNRDAEWIHYPHSTHYAGGEMAYWSWKNIGDHDRPLQKSQTRYRVPKWPRVFVDVTSPQFLDKYERDSLESHAAAIQNGIDLSEGHGLQFEWDEQNNVAVPSDAYEGSPVANANDNRKRILLWSRRHARLYTDPHGRSFGWDKQCFEVVAFQHGVAHPEYDDFLHMGLIPGEQESQAIRQGGMPGNQGKPCDFYTKW